MERKLARYLYQTTVYTGVRNEHVMHHLVFEFAQSHWGAKLLCNDQIVAGGETNKTSWENQPFLLEETVTCLTCLVNAGSWSS